MTLNDVLTEMSNIGQAIEGLVALSAFILAWRYGLLDKLKEVSHAKQLESRADVARAVWREVYFLFETLETFHLSPVQPRDIATAREYRMLLVKRLTELIPLVADLELVISPAAAVDVHALYALGMKVDEACARFNPNSSDTVLLVNSERMKLAGELKEKIRQGLERFAKLDVA